VSVCVCVCVCKERTDCAVSVSVQHMCISRSLCVCVCVSLSLSLSVPDASATREGGTFRSLSPSHGRHTDRGARESGEREREGTRREQDKRGGRRRGDRERQRDEETASQTIGGFGHTERSKWSREATQLGGGRNQSARTLSFLSFFFSYLGFYPSPSSLVLCGLFVFRCLICCPLAPCSLFLLLFLFSLLSRLPRCFHSLSLTVCLSLSLSFSCASCKIRERRGRDRGRAVSRGSHRQREGERERQAEKQTRRHTDTGGRKFREGVQHCDSDFGEFVTAHGLFVSLCVSLSVCLSPLCLLYVCFPFSISLRCASLFLAVSVSVSVSISVSVSLSGSC